MFCNSPPRAMARMENSVRRKNNTLDKNQRAFVHLLDIVTPVGALKTVIYACVKNGPEQVSRMLYILRPVLIVHHDGAPPPIIRTSPITVRHI
jgi:hypothetical protein